MYTLLSWLERLSALAVAILLLPLFAIVVAVTAALSKSALLVAHRRVGRNGVPFWMLKFRTMWNGRGGAAGLVEHLSDSHVPHVKNGDDPRVTSRFAAFCRRHSIDELPQLWHVVRGEMSLVGPRPVTATELLRYYGEDAREVLEMKPGLAGLWQVSGRNRLTYDERRALDLELGRRKSLRLYVEILLRTLPEVMNGEN